MLQTDTRAVSTASVGADFLECIFHARLVCSILSLRSSCTPWRADSREVRNIWTKPTCHKHPEVQTLCYAETQQEHFTFGGWGKPSKLFRCGGAARGCCNRGTGPRSVQVGHAPSQHQSFLRTHTVSTICAARVNAAPPVVEPHLKTHIGLILAFSWALVGCYSGGPSITHHPNLGQNPLPGPVFDHSPPEFGTKPVARPRLLSLTTRIWDKTRCQAPSRRRRCDGPALRSDVDAVSASVQQPYTTPEASCTRLHRPTHHKGSIQNAVVYIVPRTGRLTTRKRTTGDNVEL